MIDNLYSMLTCLLVNCLFEYDFLFCSSFCFTISELETGLCLLLALLIPLMSALDLVHSSASRDAEMVVGVTREDLLQKIAELEMEAGRKGSGVLAGVVTHELHHFFALCRRSSLCTRCLSTMDEVGKSGGEEVFEHYVSRCLAAMQQEKQSLQDALHSLQSEVVSPLRATVEKLQSDNDQLRQELSQLQEEVACGNVGVEDANQIPAARTLVEELRQLRAQEQVLRQQLQVAHEVKGDLSTKMMKAITDGTSASIDLVPQLTLQVRERDALIRDGQTSCHILQLQMDEAQKRFHEELQCSREELNAWRRYYVEGLIESEKRYANLKARSAVTEEGAQGSASPSVSGMKRQRDDCETEGANGDVSDPNDSTSLRTKFLRFWYDGHDELARLNLKVKELEEKASQLRVSQGQVAQLDRHTHFLYDQLITLSHTVEHLREEEREHLKEITGLKVSCDCLVNTLSRTLEPVMTPTELANCADVIRAAAASSAVMVDPKALEDAAQLAQERKAEVEKLNHQKEGLLRFISMREERVRALLEQEVLLTRAHQARSGTETLPLVQLLELTRQCAADIFRDCRTSVLGPAMASSVGSHYPSNDCLWGDGSLMTLQRNLQLSQQEALTAKGELCILTEQRDRALSTGTFMQESLSISLTEKEDLIQALQNNSNVMMEHVERLQLRLRGVEEDYRKLHHFTTCATEGMSCLFELLKQEMASSTQLREMALKERQHLRGLVQRTINEQSEGTRNSNDEVIHALKQVELRIKEEITYLQVMASSEASDYVLDMVKAIQKQEGNLKHIQSRYDEHIAAFSQRLSSSIESAHQNWDKEWERRFEDSEAQRKHIMLRYDARNALFQRVEQIQAKGNAEPHVPLSSTKEAVGEAIKAIEDFLTRSNSVNETVGVMADQNPVDSEVNEEVSAEASVPVDETLASNESEGV